MRFLFLTSPATRKAHETLGQMREKLTAVEILSFTAQPGMEGVGVMEAASRFDAEDFAKTFGRESGAPIRVLPL